MKTILNMFSYSIRLGCRPLADGLKLAAVFGLVLLAGAAAAQTNASGTFQFTTDTYKVSEFEQTSPLQPGINLAPSLLGARVTVTRTSGSSGRVLVPILTTSFTNYFLVTNVFDISNNLVFLSQVRPLFPPDAGPNLTNSITFDDYQMSASSLMTSYGDQATLVPGSSVTNTPYYLTNIVNTTTNISTNTLVVFTISVVSTGVGLLTPVLDALESTNLLLPQLGSTVQQSITVAKSVPNQFSGSYYTNSVINLERSTFRISKGKSPAIIYLHRTGGAGDKAVTVSYAINQSLPHPVKSGMDGNPAPGNTFALEAGSDYAVAGTDFQNVSGTVTWAANDNNDKTISITLLNPGTPAFNLDLQLQIFVPVGSTEPVIIGGIDRATLTILGDEQPAGAVDRTWNKDNGDGFDSNPPYLKFPGTKGGASDSANGNGGTVNAVVEQADGKAIIAGSFNSYDSNPYNYIVRLLSNGYQDPTFLVSPNSGANDVIAAMALQTDGKIVIGGNFTSFNGESRPHIARLNSDGTVDGSFNPGLGADGTVQAVAVNPEDGTILIGGSFTNYGGVASSYVARLNPDGSRDTNFNVGNTVNGAVNAIAINGVQTINLDITPSGTETEDVQRLNLGVSTSGILQVAFDMFFVPDRMTIYYGGTNDVRIYDSGSVAGYTNFALPFGPTNGFTTNVITIVMNQGGGLLGTVWIYNAVINTYGDKTVYIGGEFTAVNGQPSGGVAKLQANGILDSTFNPGIGTYNPDTGFTDPVKALAIQNGKLLVAGGFSYMELADYNGIVRLNTDGTIDLTFNPGADAQNGTYNPLSGKVDTIYALTLQTDGKILIGGNFTTYNQTRRVGIARLFDNGSLDTSFMDTAYNQFAGLINHYYKSDAVNTNDYPAGNHRNAVRAIAVEPSSPNNVIIGGDFLRVGGGSVDHDGINMPAYTNVVFQNARMDSHPRSNVARLIGGSTTGPGNISLLYNTYSVDKTAGTLYVSMARTNGTLGTIAATVKPQFAEPGPGIATTNNVTGGATPTWPTLYQISTNDFWPKAPGTYGPNFSPQPQPPLGIHGTALADVYFSIINNTNITGNLNANIALNSPDGSSFKLGGEVVPLGAALGQINLSPLTVIDNNFKPGVLGFSSPTYTVNQNGGTATITVVRTNGTDGIVSVNYDTANGTATNGINFNNVSGTLTFNPGESSHTFTIPIISGSTVSPDKTVNLLLSTVTGGAMIGLTNAVLTIINNNFTPGHVSFTSLTFTTNEPNTTGAAAITINRLGGSSGTLAVTFAATNGTATNGVQFTGLTNSLTWNNGDVSTKTALVPLLHDGISTTPDLNVNVRLYNPLVNTKLNTNALGLNTNALLTIGNIDFPGTVQFTSGRYSVKKYAGYALVPVVRVGGSAQAISVTYNTADGTAIAPADYTATNNTLTFANGEVSKYIQVPIVDNAASIGLKTLTVQLTGAVGSPALATLNIIDTDEVDETPGSDDPTYSPTAGFNNAVFALALQTNNNKLVVGGDFTQADGVPRRRIARLNANGTLDASFSLPSSTMGVDASVRAVVVQSDGRIVIGGQFTNCNSFVNRHIARLNQDGALDSLFNVGAGADNTVFALAETFAGGARKIIVGGSFATLNGTTFHGIGRLNDNGAADTSFNPGGLGANAEVYAVAVQTDGKIVIGGNFTSVNGVTANHLARLNVNGTVDTTFTGSGANDSVLALAVQLDGKILLGGAFTNVNGSVQNHLARLNSNGSTDLGFTSGVGADDLVTTIALQTDTRIVLGGQFTHCSGVTRSRITRLNPDGTVDPTINFGSGADGFVSAMVIQQDNITGYPTNVPDEKIIIGGGFAHYNGEVRQRVARIQGGSISGVGAFEFSTSDFYQDESVLSAVITVIRTGGTMGTNANGSGNISVPFTTSDGSAIAGVNYQTVVTNIIFPMGEVQQTVNIPLIRDFVITNDLDVNLALDPILPASYGDQPTAKLHIVNDDAAVNFSAPTYQVTKNVINGVATINVLRLGTSYGTASVIFNTTTNGSATPGLDYTPVTNYLVTFNPGVTNVAVNIPITNNAVPEGFRTVEIQLTNPVNTVLYSPSNAVLTIIDTVYSAGQISFSATNYNVTPSDGSAVLKVIRTNGSSGTISVDYHTIAQTAVPGNDYVASSGQLTFIAGVVSQNINVPLLSQTLVQPPVTFSVVLSNLVGGAQMIAPTNATVNIISSIAGISFVAATNTAPENSGAVNVLVQRLFNTNNVVSVNYATAPDTALANVNYLTTAGTLSFTNGESTKVLSIALVNRTNVTGDLKFSVKLSSPVGAQLLAQSNTVVVIQDADAGISFTNSTVRVLKNSGSATITVVCSNPRVEPIVTDTNSVPLSVRYYTADGTALAGTDYQAVSGTLVFTNGIATNTFDVPIFNNAAVSGDHAFSVILTNVTAPGQITPYGTQTVVISESNPGFRFSSPTYTVFENAVQAGITVYRTGFTDTVASVNFTATNGTAVNGANFFATNGTLVFTNGETVKSFNVPIIANIAVQPNLTVLLQLLNPTNGTLVAPSAAILNILENGGSYVVPAGATLVSESGPVNGIIENGETVQVLFAFRDAAGLNVTNLIAYLLATNGVTAPSPASQVYSNLRVYGHSVSRPFTFTASGTNALPIAATFRLYDNGSFIGTALFGFTLGSWTTTFSNTAAIIINDNTNASPYPSVINVSGVGGTLIKATATLNGLSHTTSADVDALVVSPAGSNTLIMAHAGGQNTVTNIVLTFDDAASNSLSHFNLLFTGTNKPTAFLPVRNFP